MARLHLVYLFWRIKHLKDLNKQKHENSSQASPIIKKNLIHVLHSPLPAAIKFLKK